MQIGLIMDVDGIPLSFSIFNGNENEQQSLKPLERKVMSESGLDEFVVCTDGGQGSLDRRFNDRFGRKFITTQSLKKLKGFLLNKNAADISNDETIMECANAYFQICFLASVVFKILETKLANRFTSEEIISTLRDMNMKIVPGQGFTPVCMRTDLMDALHVAFGFRKDRQIVSAAQVKRSCSKTMR